jgi:hypothetical protein
MLVVKSHETYYKHVGISNREIIFICASTLANYEREEVNQIFR